jgi:hypothetical protein
VVAEPLATTVEAGVEDSTIVMVAEASTTAVTGAEVSITVVAAEVRAGGHAEYRRSGGGVGCYSCGRYGHYARECFTGFIYFHIDNTIKYW